MKEERTEKDRDIKEKGDGKEEKKQAREG